MSDDKQTNLTDDLLADPFSTATDATAEPNIPEATTAKPKLNPEQEAKARDLASKIDVTKGETVLNYGADAQKQLGVFSQNMLTKVQSQDTGAVGDALTSLMTRLNEANPDELKAENNNIFRKIFGRVKRSIYEITAKYQKIGAQIDTIANRLETSQQGLLNDNKLLDELYDQNKAYFDALNIYIEAANLKIAELNEKTIPEAAKAAEAANDQMAIQQVNDLKQFASRLEKRAYD